MVAGIVEVAHLQVFGLLIEVEMRLESMEGFGQVCKQVVVVDIVVDIGRNNWFQGREEDFLEKVDDSAHMVVEYRGIQKLVSDLKKKGLHTCYRLRGQLSPFDSVVVPGAPAALNCLPTCRLWLEAPSVRLPR